MTTVDSSKVNLFDDALIRKKVYETWDRIFAASNKVIRDANHYGFRGMEVIPDPNIFQLLVNLQIFASVIDILVSNADQFSVGYDELRMLLNAKEQITRMELLAAALRANNRKDFDEALESLERQACF